MPAATRSLRVRATRRGHLVAGRSCGVPAPPAVAGGARLQGGVKTGVGRLRGGDLVGVWLRNTERFEGLHHARMHPLRPGGVLRLAGRDGVHVGDLLGQGGGGRQFGEEGTQGLLGGARKVAEAAGCAGCRR